MFSLFERTIAFRYLRSRKSEGFLSVITAFSLIGIALGVATLIVVMAVMNGFRDELITRIVGLNGQISVYATTPETSSDFNSLAIKIHSLDSVKNVTPILQGQVMASKGRKYTGAIVRGFQGSDIENFKLLTSNIISGSIEEFKANKGILIGYEFARKLNVKTGDNLGIISPQSTSTAFGSVPRARNYRISGVFNSGMFEYDSGFIFMPLSLAQLHFKMPESITRIDVDLNDSRNVEKISLQLQEIVGKNWFIQNWKQRHSQFFNALKVERYLMFIILALIILVAAFNIISGLIMAVKDKEHDIAILRTMGATRAQIMKIFFINGASIGVFGTLIGVLLGIVFAINIDSIRIWVESLTGVELFAAKIRFLSELPVTIAWENILPVILISLLLSFLATLYPSWKASKVDPAKALRDE
tara:strand:- start:2814 stop:4061 length:1248 start_codon:yes stop_codon:yes gene_type:complete